jgi:hypothetical protein
MTSKTDAEKPSDPTAPGSPRKSPQRDYSSLPQRPIKLKKGVDLPDALKQEPTKPKTKPAPKRKAKKAERIPTPKKKRKQNNQPKESPAPTELTINGLSLEAKRIATEAAAQEGISANDWLERLIRQSIQTPQKTDQPKTSEENLSAALHSIDQRLVHLEQQKGFWARFWDQFMEQSKNKE